MLYIGCHRFPLSTVAAMALHLGMADEAPVQYFWNYNPENLLERGKLYLEWVNTPSATAPAEAPPAEAPPVEVPPCG